MQENEIDDRSADRARGNAVARHRAHENKINRSAYLTSLAVALVGFGLAGVSAVTTGPDRPASAPADAIPDERARAAAAQRADRSEREPAPVDAPATPATAEPSNSSGPAAAATRSSASDRPAAEPSPKRAWVSPLPGAAVTSCYGQRWGVLHAGIDLAKPANTPIHAVAAGTVVTAGWAYPGYGISVMIDHGNGYLTHYAHQNKTAVRVGQKVAAGDTIGYEGSTGDSTGPHLHFEVHKGLWNQINPAPWMRARGVNLGC